MVLLLIAGSSLVAQSSVEMVGADISFLSAAERHGVAFRDNGRAEPALQILKDHGYNWIRLRIFCEPAQLPNDLAYTIAAAREAKRYGFKFLLDIHYSDDWADPDHQRLPKAWESKNHQELVAAVFAYTRDTIAALREAGVMPEMVQIGNEVTAGLLWPDGRLPEHWGNFAQLIQAGIKGVEAGAGEQRPRIMIHIDRGGDWEGCRYFFDRLNSYGASYDVIGLSYYPWWHGSMQQLHQSLAFVSHKYRKDVVVVETAYNWKPTEYIGRTAPFAESPEGQRAFVAAVRREIERTPGGRGKGIFWWEPAVEGTLASRGLFDDQHNALPALAVFDRPGCT
jgi:arabinogalactan endo-1,4-beta-galactosidase